MFTRTRPSDFPSQGTTGSFGKANPNCNRQRMLCTSRRDGLLAEVFPFSCALDQVLPLGHRSEILHHRVRGPRIDHNLRCLLVGDSIRKRPHVPFVKADVLLPCAIALTHPVRRNGYHSLPFVQLRHPSSNLELTSFHSICQSRN
jgi:hypothetical protein